MKEKKLILLNGRWLDSSKSQHAYIAANSVADAIRMCQEVSGGRRGWAGEIKQYFAKNCWGNKMAGITPERGIWVDDNNYKSDSKPRRIL